MKTLLSSILLLIFNISCYAQWVEKDLSNITTTWLSDIYAITPDIVIITGANGTILKSTDAGTTWQQKNCGTDLYLREIQFPTSKIGYVLAGGNTLLKTKDAGETWTQFPIENISGIDVISCVNENLIFLNTNKGLIKSEDGGATWSAPVQSPFFGEHGIQMQFFDRNVGFVGIDEMSYLDNGDQHWENRLAKTTDAGKSWQIFDAIAPFHFLNENLGFYYFQKLYKITNSGNQIEGVGGYSAHTLRKIIAIDENTIWGILDARALNYDTSSQGVIKLTKNEAGEYVAKGWYDNSFDIDMTSMHFANDNAGYIIGRAFGKNKLWKNTTGSNVGLNTTETDKINLVKIFPNPTSDKINIQIDTQLAKEFSINLTEMSGKLVFEKIYKNHKEVVIDVKNLSKGTYLVNIKGQNQASSQKIIVK
ncbi:T9SS type A sorting domain-containing protein [Soonwooa sp.]|uniref:T9SS type A sorting domain-containing protein n=1 Tax=Soonwooa sp. TaxID=1938592 RepID=UPI00262A9710|nr:T9SS type A sorting domain-containing protein [Soonwooa sp.]